MKDLWIEKYRPKVLDDVVGQPEIVERLKMYVGTTNMPHMMFAGPAGTGKTTCAIALSHQMFGDSWSNNFQELNASDQRGIDVVRKTIKDFARTSPLGGTLFKIIFLDEADALTSDAQSALRRTMEKYSATCRFILSCNYSSKIIDPIQSRCAVFRFRQLLPEDVTIYINRIAEAEKIEITEDGIQALLYVSGGDLRKATNVFQVASVLGTKVDSEAVYKTSSTGRPKDIIDMMEVAISGKFTESRDILDRLLIDYGLSGEDIIRQMHRNVFEIDISEFGKVRFIDKMGEIEFRIIEGSNSRIQIESLLAYFSLVGKEFRK
ncbi:MAG: replication factor C small subunit [Candidatus Thermoplasmatota archaeon]|nr:replication factor C small subunit [Euryarchaeota archaeon]MBU4031241.1 replication factor C small subunit [Candidatus Thermoplasmatota archaeon]MBU4071239.1 replication factor C small subunit [Candidatus Thermoplasmatota archaeon]MBU4592254.1 replication factor C small subunit [Candidatus Thermoplasmatota archaeon]